MNEPAPGDYRVVRVKGGTVAVCEFTCPFCKHKFRADLAARCVMARPTFLTTACTRCGLNERYAPKTNP